MEQKDIAPGFSGVLHPLTGEPDTHRQSHSSSFPLETRICYGDTDQYLTAEGLGKYGGGKKSMLPEATAQT